MDKDAEQNWPIAGVGGEAKRPAAIEINRSNLLLLDAPPNNSLLAFPAALCSITPCNSHDLSPLSPFVPLSPASKGHSGAAEGRRAARRGTAERLSPAEPLCFRS